MDYLSLPVLPRDGHLPRTDLRESITQWVGLILTTRVGQLPFYPEFGCALWDREYSDLLVANRAEVRAALRNAIARFETRLYDLSVSFDADRVSESHSLGMKVRVSANFRDNGVVKKFESTYSLG